MLERVPLGHPSTGRYTHLWRRRFQVREQPLDLACAPLAAAGRRDALVVETPRQLTKRDGAFATELGDDRAEIRGALSCRLTPNHRARSSPFLSCFSIKVPRVAELYPTALRRSERRLRPLRNQPALVLCEHGEEVHGQLIRLGQLGDSETNAAGLAFAFSAPLAGVGQQISQNRVTESFADAALR